MLMFIYFFVIVCFHWSWKPTLGEWLPCYKIYSLFSLLLFVYFYVILFSDLRDEYVWSWFSFSFQATFNSVPLFWLQTSLQVVFVCTQDNIWLGNIRIHGCMSDHAWCKSDVCYRTRYCHGVWSDSVVLWTLFWCTWQRFRWNMCR